MGKWNTENQRYMGSGNVRGWYLSLLVLPLFCYISGSALIAQVPSAEREYANGVSAREKGDLVNALSYLERAIELDPSMTKAHFALAITAQEFAGPPASPQPERAAIAVREFKKVIQLDPSHRDASFNLAYLLYTLNKLDESEYYFRKTLALNSDDPEAACSVAAIDARRTWSEIVMAKNGAGWKLGKPLIGLRSCADVRVKNLSRVEEGIVLVTRALRRNPDNVDLMAFLSLLYRERADIQCGNRQAYDADMSVARKWNRSRKELQRREEPGHEFLKCLPAPPPMP